MALGGELAEFPDYVAPEEGEQSWEAVEAELDAFLASQGGAFMYGGRKTEAPVAPWSPSR